MNITVDMITRGVEALDHDPAISDESRVRLVLEVALLGVLEELHAAKLRVIDPEQDDAESRIYRDEILEERNEARAQVKYYSEAIKSVCAERDSAVRERDEARAQTKAEQTAWLKTMDRLCKAMGQWTGPWDVAAEARLKATKRGLTARELEGMP